MGLADLNHLQRERRAVLLQPLLPVDTRLEEAGQAEEEQVMPFQRLLWCCL